MNQKKLYISVIVLILAIITIVILYFVFFQKPKPAPTTTPPISNNGNTQSATTTPSETPALSGDNKNIVANGKILLAIDDDIIFDFFKTKSQLCDESNINTTPERKMFCEDKTTFKDKTNFTSVVSSPDKIKVGFSIESDALSPDKVVGIFYPNRTDDKVIFLTNYYLGNEFISFSPNGTYFIYQGNCFEGMCGLFIKNSKTLADKINFNNPSEGLDARSVNSEFVRWLSDNSIEYKLGKELKLVSF